MVWYQHKEEQVERWCPPGDLFQQRESCLVVGGLTPVWAAIIILRGRGGGLTRRSGSPDSRIAGYQPVWDSR